MAVAFDASSVSSSGTGDLSWTHTPVGTPRGVIVYVVQNASGADSVTGVTYGGVAMSQVSGSPNLKGTGEPGGIHAYFLGASIPTGAQTVAVATSGTVTKVGYAVTVTGIADTEVVDTDATINSDSVANPESTLNLSGRTCFVSEAIFNGSGTLGFVNEVDTSTWTTQRSLDFGAQITELYTYDIIDDVDVVIGAEAGADDCIVIAVAVSEVAAVATAYTFTGPTSGTVNVASTNFTVTPNGTATATVTPATDGSGSFTPSSVTFDGTAAAKTFTYTPTDTAGSPHTLSTSDDGGLTETSGTIDYTVTEAGGLLLLNSVDMRNMCDMGGMRG